MATPEDWDIHFYRIYKDLRADGMPEHAASHAAELHTEIEWGPRPEELG
jgi:hypothetical protein